MVEVIRHWIIFNMNLGTQHRSLQKFNMLQLFVFQTLQCFHFILRYLADSLCELKVSQVCGVFLFSQGHATMLCMRRRSCPKPHNDVGKYKFILFLLFITIQIYKFTTVQLSHKYLNRNMQKYAWKSPWQMKLHLITAESIRMKMTGTFSNIRSIGMQMNAIFSAKFLPTVWCMYHIIFDSI